MPDEQDVLDEGDPGLRDALWVSRCVGRSDSAPLPPCDVEQLARRLVTRRLEAGEPLHREGDEPTHVYIVREGRIELSVRSRGTRVVIQTMRSGDVDGDIQMLLGLPLPYEARAPVPATCLLLDRAGFDALLADHPPVARRWLTSVSGRLARSHQRLTTLLGQPLDAQVAQLLLDESSQDVAHLSQATLAAMLGARRPSVNRILRRFADDGLVEIGYGKVRLLRPDGLRRLAQP